MKHDAEDEQFSEGMGEVADLVYHAVGLWKIDASSKFTRLKSAWK